MTKGKYTKKEIIEECRQLVYHVDTTYSDIVEKLAELMDYEFSDLTWTDAETGWWLVGFSSTATRRTVLWYAAGRGLSFYMPQDGENINYTPTRDYIPVKYLGKDL